MAVAVVSVLLLGWLALAGLTVSGAHARGQRLPMALVAGLCFPVTWTVCYVRDEQGLRGR